VGVLGIVAGAGYSGLGGHVVPSLPSFASESASLIVLGSCLLLAGRFLRKSRVSQAPQAAASDRRAVALAK
jgi:hypothetical protein